MLRPLITLFRLHPIRWQRGGKLINLTRKHLSILPIKMVPLSEWMSYIGHAYGHLMKEERTCAHLMTLPVVYLAFDL